MKKILAIFMLAFIFACTSQPKAVVDAEKQLNLANAYYTNGLYDAAVQTYLDYLEQNQVDANRTANTYYTIANIYFERTHDYQKALEFYFRIKYLYPESKLNNEISKKLVACLERLKKSDDAQRIYARQAALDKKAVEENRPGAVVAEIADRKITQGDLDFQISRLPAYMQEALHDKNQKKEYLKQYILQELLYGSAKRQGLDKDKDVIEGAFQAQKSLMAEKVLQQELKDKVKIEDQDVELYYLAHKDRYVEKDDKGKTVRQKELAEVGQQVAQDLARERQQQAYQQLAERLFKAENVKLYETRVH